MHRTLILSSLTCLLGGAACAHDFWLEPSQFSIADASRIEVSAKVGHGSDVEEWPADPNRVIALRLISEDGIEDVQGELANRRSQGHFGVSIVGPGVHVLTLESTRSVSELPADAFNAYVAEEGLTPIAEHRAALGLDRQAGREVYSRRAKSIIVSGPVSEADCTAKVLAPVGMTLEITPMMLPSCVEPGASLAVEVRYRGQPLPGATLHLVRLGEGGGDVGRSVTGESGVTNLPYPGNGNWMLQTVWSSPLNGDERAEYNTVFSSLSFSIGGDS